MQHKAVRQLHAVTILCLPLTNLGPSCWLALLQPGAAPQQQLRGHNGLAFAAAAAAASAECYVADEAARVAGIDGQQPGFQQPGFHPGWGGAPQPQNLQARARVPELARRPAQLQKAVRHEAARRQQAGDAVGREQDEAWPQEPQTQLGRLFESATGLQLNNEALRQLQWQQGLLAEQPEFGREVALPTFAVGHGPQALAPSFLQQQQQQLQQQEVFTFQVRVFHAAATIGLPPAPAEQHAPTAEAPLLPAAGPGGLARQMAGLGLHRAIPAGLSQDLGAAMAGALKQ